MKKLKFIIALTTIASVFALSASAQTDTNLPPINGIPNFVNQAALWGTSFDTNKSWANVTLQFEDGMNQVTGIGAADYVRGQYDLGKFNLSAEGDFFGVGSSFNSVEGGFGYALIQKYDFKAELNVLGGGTKVSSTSGLRFIVEPEIKITKLMTVNTYATASLSVPWIQSKAFDGTPTFRVGLGFVF